jgi:hypothetical protein
MITDHKIVLISVLLGFIFFMGLGYTYTNHYNIPFGMSDIDRYLCFLQMPSIAECEKLTAYTFFTHFYVFFIFANQTPQMINYTVNMFIWLLMPVCFYIFAREWLENQDNAVHSILYLMFGTYIYFFFGYMMLLAQLTSFIFYLLSLAFLTEKQYKKGLIFAFMAFIGHPYVLIIYILWFLAYGIYHKKHHLILPTLILTLLLFNFGGLSYFTVFFNTRPQPTLYDVFFIFTNPLLSFLFFIGLLVKKPDVNHVFTLILLFTAPFSNLSRALPFLHVMMVVYAYIGLKHIMKKARHGQYIEFVFLCSLILHFLYMFSYFNGNMLHEMGLRGLSSDYFRNILGL